MLKLTLSFLLFAVLFFVLVRLYAHKTIFPGNTTLSSLPEDSHSFFITIESNKHVEILELPLENPEFSMLLLHGNGCNAYTHLEFGQALREAGGHIFLLNLPGYGHSKGSPNEMNTVHSVITAVQQIEELCPGIPFFLMGQSLGGAIVIQAANQIDLDGLIVESSFSTLKDMAQHTMGHARALLFHLQPIRFDSISAVRRIKSPKLFLHAREDAVVPFELGEKLFQAAAEPKERVVFDIPGHCDHFYNDRDKYMKALISFIEQNTKHQVKK